MNLNVKDLSNEELFSLVNDIQKEIEARHGKWGRYIDYLHQWADEHDSIAYANQSPACYDEWLDNENFLEEDYLRANA